MLKKNHKKILCVIILMMGCISTKSNNIKGTNDTTFVRMFQFAFPKATENILVDKAETLAPFFNRLRELKNDSNFVVSICHVGDSHIQGDIQTGTTRKMLQTFFGNAGRGLMTPLKLAKTNEPPNYKITSPQEWSSIRCIKPGNYTTGIGGLVLINNNSTSTVKIETLDKINPEKWDFNQITVFYDTSQTKLSIPDSNQIKYIEEAEKYDFSKTFILEKLTNNIDLVWNKTSSDPILFYGVSVQNGQKGILYHSIGINGAHYEDYVIAQEPIRQIKGLNPSLIIISMGINEAYDKGFNSAEFYKSIGKMIQQIKTECPNSILLLTTPAETWYKFRRSKYRKPHPNIALARNTIVQYAKDNQLAYWDLFSITGGKGSAQSWKKHKLLRPDGIHFSQEGYEFIGEMFFEAIFKAFNKYSDNFEQKLNIDN